MSDVLIRLSLIESNFNCGNTRPRIIKSKCPDCRSSGKNRETVKLSVKIPPGIDTGQKLKLRGEGEPGFQGGPAGDLYVVIEVDQHPFFQREGEDLHCEVPTLDGSVKLKIPTGTQNQKRFRLKAKGISSLDGRNRGDQYVTVIVEVPTKLTSEQKQLLEKFAAISASSYPESDTFVQKMKDWFN